MKCPVRFREFLIDASHKTCVLLCFLGDHFSFVLRKRHQMIRFEIPFSKVSQCSLHLVSPYKLVANDHAHEFMSKLRVENFLIAVNRLRLWPLSSNSVDF